MKIALLCGIMLVLFSAGARRALAYHEVGAGVDTCATWTSDRQTPGGAPAIQDEQWVLGFLTGVGFAGSDQDDPLTGMDAQAVWKWIDTYCQRHPSEKIVTAARAFFKFHPH